MVRHAESAQASRAAAVQSSASSAVLEAHGIYKIFVSAGARGPVATTALRDVSLVVRRGEFLSLIGPSGCGKSTLLNMFAGLTAPEQGSILHDGHTFAGVNTSVGYVTQEDNLLPWRTTLSNVELALELRGVPRRERQARARTYLDRVGLNGFEHHFPHQLSGGMRKRASIVRTIVDESVDVILMDEPFGPLDAQTRLILQDQLLRLWEGTGLTIVFVTHDIVEAIALSDRIAVLTSRPGSIKRVHDVTLARPRDVFHIHETPGFADIYGAVWADLRDEIILTSRQSDDAA